MLVGKGWKVRVPGVVKNVLHHYMIWFLKSCSAKYLRLFGTIISRWSLQHVCKRYCTYAIVTQLRWTYQHGRRYSKNAVILAQWLI